MMQQRRKEFREASRKYNSMRDADRLPVYIRLADTGDSSFVYKSWLDSWWVQNKDQFQPLFYKTHREIISRLMEDAITVIACSDEDPNLIFAWMCGLRTSNNRLVIHYCYTKEAFRKFGLAKTLLRYFEHDKGEPIQVKDLVTEFLQANPHFVSAGPQGSGTGAGEGKQGTTAQTDINKLDLTKPGDRELYKKLMREKGVVRF